METVRIGDFSAESREKFHERTCKEQSLGPEFAFSSRTLVAYYDFVSKFFISKI
jgi:hypothetical protein